LFSFNPLLFSAFYFVSVVSCFALVVSCFPSRFLSLFLLICLRPYIHVEGRVSAGNLIEGINIQPMNNNFDIVNYNQSCELMMGKYSYLFGISG
jgi:hypothetical protein